MTSNPIQVMHLIDTGDPGGAETVFLSLANLGKDLGQTAAVVVAHEGWLSAELTASGIDPVILPSRGLLNVRLLNRLVRMARRQQVSLIHAHLLGSSTYASLTGLWLRTPVIAVFHGATDLADPGRFLWLKRRLLQRRSLQLVAVSDGVKEALVRWGIPAQRITIIANGVDTDRFSPGHSRSVQQSLDLPADAYLIGAVGNIRPAKAYEVMIEAARYVVQADSRVHFAIAGQGSTEALARLRALAEAHQVGDHVHFLGFQPSSADRYRSFELFVSSARTEGLPLSFLEAMACGTPIVATENEGSGPLLRSTHAGVLTPNGDPDSLASAILQLMQDPAQTRLLGIAGREAAVQHYSLAATHAAYQALYARMLA